MSENPYKPPDSDINNKPPKRNTSGWMVFCWINAFLTLVTVLAIPQIPDFTLLDLLSNGVNVVAAVGLYGFAYYKPIHNVVFWRYFFYVAIIDFVVNGLIMGVIDISHLEQSGRLWTSYLFWMLYSLAVLYGINHYSYKRPFIWQRLPPD